MSAEALWRAVVEVIGHICDGKSGVLKKASSTNKPCHCEIPFGRRGSSSKESAHQRTGSDIELLRELADIPDARRASEDRFEKMPAIGSPLRKIDS
jgi:hypothetical protein